MSSRIDTVLILGAAGGIGDAVARKFHGMGKTIIATGREEDEKQLQQLAKDAPGLEYLIWDLTKLDEIQSQVERILDRYPMLDTVFVNAGIQNHYHVFDQQTDQEEIIRELTTNLTAPILVSHYFARHLLSLAERGVKTNLFLTSSSLAYFPVPFYPIYCPSKAGIAAFAKILRAQLKATGCKDMNVVEVVPPYVDTGLNESHRHQTDALQGGEDKAVQPMPLAQYIDSFILALEQAKPDGSFQNEIGVGFGAQGAEVWYEGIEKLLARSGMAE